MLTVLEVIKKTTDFFASKTVENPRLNAEVLIGHALGLKRMQLYLQFERLLTEAELEKVRPLVRRRSQHEPLQYVLGETEWFGLHLKTDRRALIPRPETERLAELVIELSADRPPARILDLGTGSGALALALAKHWPEALVTAVDRSAEALVLARENAAANTLEARVDFLESDWFSALSPERKFSLVVANPPYLSAGEVAAAAREVREHEPHGALIADDGGIADLRRIVAAAPAFLETDGLLAMETGIGHHPELLTLCASAGFTRSESRPDLAGRERFVFAWRA